MTTDSILLKLSNKAIAGQSISHNEAMFLAELPKEYIPDLFAAASRVREYYFKNQVSLCSIVNAKSGRCPEDCAFCAQSAHYMTPASSYPLLDIDVLLEGAARAAESGSVCYGIVTSGTGISDGDELERICAAIQAIRAEGVISPAASLGTLTKNAAESLKSAGLVTYHHNLETARSYFPQICSTHDYEDDLETIKIAKEAGLRVCCGGLFGIGENMEQRIELAETLRELQVDSVPINFLDPVTGTPLAEMNQLTPLLSLQIISIFRHILPDVFITICGGRQRNLRELQSFIFMAGASGVMTGNYLTKAGRSPEDDHQMIKDLGLLISKEIMR